MTKTEVAADGPFLLEKSLSEGWVEGWSVGGGLLKIWAWAGETGGPSDAVPRVGCQMIPFYGTRR